MIAGAADGSNYSGEFLRGDGSSTELDISTFADPTTKNAADLVTYAIHAWESGWGYVWGTYGCVLTDSLFAYKLEQYPDGVGNYEDFIRANWLGGRTTDCVGLIKGYGWLNPETSSIDYKELVDAAQDSMRGLIYRMQHQLCESPIIEAKMSELVQALAVTTGKKQYGYLKKPVKQLVDAIVDELAKLPEVAECYEVWNQLHEELNGYYGNSTPWERLPLSERKEFRKIKNDIVREAENIRLGLLTFEDEQMQDEPEPEESQNEHQSYCVYEQAQRYRVAKAVLQDIDALDEEHAEAILAIRLC